MLLFLSLSHASASRVASHDEMLTLDVSLARFDCEGCTLAAAAAAATGKRTPLTPKGITVPVPAAADSRLSPPSRVLPSQSNL